jgi:hypothetical protein
MSNFQLQPIGGIPAARVSGNPNALAERLGETPVSAWLAEYAAMAWSGKIFTAYAAAQATTVVGTAMVGLQLWNGSPVAGGVNAILLYAGGAIIAASSTQTGVLLASGVGQTSAPTGQTAATRSASNFIGGAAPQCLALNAGTFASAPTAFMTLLHNTAGLATTGEDPGYFQELKGMIVVPPQTYVCFAALGATGAASSNQHHLVWAELPV